MNPHPLLLRARYPAAIALLAFSLMACDQPPTGTAVKRADLQQTPKPVVSAAGERPGASVEPDRVSTLVAQARAAEPAERSGPTPGEPSRAKPPAATAGTAKSGRPVSDTELASRVKSAVLAQPLSALMFNVSVSNGIVTLSGTADSQETRDKAARAASEVDGVRSVNNRISVVSGS